MCSPGPSSSGSERAGSGDNIEGLANKQGETGALIKGAHRLGVNKTLGRMIEGRKALAFNCQYLSWRDVRGLFRQHYLSDENTAVGWPTFRTLW